MLDNEYVIISKFSQHTGITSPSLRHYDRLGLLVPAARSAKGNYRLYSPLQIPSARTIQMLAEINTPLDTIKQLLKCNSPRQLSQFLDTSRGRVTAEIRRLYGLCAVIGVTMGLLSEASLAEENEIKVVEMPEKKIVLGGTNNYSGSTGFAREYTRFCDASNEHSHTASFPVGGYFESMDAFLTRPSQPCRFYFIDPGGQDCKGAGRYLTGYTRGFYGETNGLPQRMAEFAEKSGLEFTGPVYNTYLTTELSESDHNHCLLQVAVPVRETHRIHLRYRRLTAPKRLKTPNSL